MAKIYNFEFDLSESSLKNVIQKMDEFKKDLIKAESDIVKALADYALSRIRFYLEESTGEFSTGNLSDSFNIEQEASNIARVYTTLYYAKYVEYGTGIVAKNNPHPNASEEGWVYDKKGHGEQGWIFPKNDEFYWTDGQAAHEFMYNTYMDLEKNYVQIATKVLKEKGLVI